jgi:ABC-type antimicrobial peptide transport system permease subunit
MVVSNYGTMSERIDRQLARPRFQLLLIGTFAVIALTLTAIGVYGLMMTVVSGRRRELGVRIALGATQSGVVSMVLRQVLAMTAAGVVLGLALAFAAARIAGSLLPGVDPADPITYAAVAVFIVLTAAAASIIPARLAAGADPLTSLRAE